MKLIVGLGNPGRKYQFTRHNIGFLMLDELCNDFGLCDFNLNSKFHGFIIEGRINGQKIFFLKPMTYMNLSGTSVQSVSSFYKIDSSDILVLHDEIDLKPGNVKYKYGGGSSGHNGLKDIIKKLGTSDFHRIRIGVGRPENKEFVADYVLSNISDNEKNLIMTKYFDIKQYFLNFINQNV